MAGKVKIESREPQASNPREAETVDALGRKIKIKKLKPSERVTLMLMLGSDVAKNEMVFGHAFLAAAVTEIDGATIYRANSLLELNVILDRLDDEGLEAVGAAYAEAFQAKPLDQAEIEAAKN